MIIFVDTELCADFDVMTDVTGHIRFARYFDRHGMWSRTG
jgi:hypothetical protein